jgi:hypothetical protein
MSCNYKTLLFGLVALSDLMTNRYSCLPAESYEQKFLPSF